MGGWDANASQRFQLSIRFFTGASGTTLLHGGLTVSFRPLAFNSSTASLIRRTSPNHCDVWIWSTLRFLLPFYEWNRLGALDNQKYWYEPVHQLGRCRLHAYDSTNLATELWNSSAGDRQFLPKRRQVHCANRGEWQVYVGTRGEQYWGHYFFDHHSGELDVYGLFNVQPLHPRRSLSNSGGAAIR